MKRLSDLCIISIFFLCCFTHMCNVAVADDTCIFTVTADDVPPNIALLLDNGAEMEQVHWHSSYDNSIDYTPNAAEKKDVVLMPATGNGFFHDNGYGIVSHGGIFFLVQIKDDLTLDLYTNGLQATSGNTWTIKVKTVSLPAKPSTVVVDGVIDNATNFRYSKNYLNWIFFSGAYAGDGSDLPNKSRFYYAKKAMMTLGKLASNKAQMWVFNFASNPEGASNVQPLKMVVTALADDPQNNALDPAFINNINNMGTVTYSPLAEGLASVGGYYSLPKSDVIDEYCQKNFVIVISPGVSSEDLTGANQYMPETFSDYDGDNATGGIGEGNVTAGAYTYPIPTNLGGSTYLDDVAYYLYTHHVVTYNQGFQNISTYTIGYMGDQEGNLFLINTSNNGNGNVNLYDTADPKYGRYHFTAESPENLSSVLLAAVDDIISKTSTFTAPVVPVTRTTSGDRIYMAFFKPIGGNFWEGNVTKFGISSTNEIVDSEGNPAAWPNGAIKKDARPYWQTKDWADNTKSNYIHNSSRNIYTYLGSYSDLRDSTNEFAPGNSLLNASVLGNPGNYTTTQVINYVRGADILDEDGDSNTSENRRIITGDVLHSEPLIVQYDSSRTRVYFGANDGMLHAVSDADGTEAWAFIPPDQLHRLKGMVEGLGHQYFVDGSPKAYIKDTDNDGVIESGDGDRVILISGEGKGGRSYFGLDVTDPDAPILLWRICGSDDTQSGILELEGVNGTFQNDEVLTGNTGGAATINGTLVGNLLNYDACTNNFSVGEVVTGGTSGATATVLSVTKHAPDNAAPTAVIPELGESWSEPQFRFVKTSDSDYDEGIPVFFIGGGYSADNSAGKAVLAINVFTGAVVRKFKNDGVNITGMNYSFASSACVIPSDDKGFADKVYVGDLGGQMWRFGRFTDSEGNPLDFPNNDKNIMNWTGHIIFVSDSAHGRKFYYQPSVTLEKGYDLVFMGTGDREAACGGTSADRIYCVKDTHAQTILEESNLVDLTDPAATPPDLNSETGDVDGNSRVDQGWYIRLATGEKVLSQGTVFYKTYYVTSFTPNDEPCLPGGVGKLYALNYKTGAAVLSFGGEELTRSVEIGGGIPSKPVMVITLTGQKLYISVGSTNPDVDSEEVSAGIVAIDPLAPQINFFYLWWREL